MIQKPDQEPAENWLAPIKTRGWQSAMHTLLNVIEPIGPLAAQMLWVLQPVATLLGGDALVKGLAQALDEPGGIEDLRKQLDDDAYGVHQDV